MLILTVKEGKKIHIGNDVEIIVSKASSNKATLGIAAPKETQINRGNSASSNQSPIKAIMRKLFSVLSRK